MFIELTPEQRQLQAELRQYFSNLISADEMKAMGEDRHNAAYRAVIRRMGRDRKLGVGWPKEFGGLGFGPIEQQIFVVYDWPFGAAIAVVLVGLVFVVNGISMWLLEGRRLRRPV